MLEYLPSRIFIHFSKLGSYVMLEPKVEFIGIASRISDGCVTLLFIKLHLMNKPLTVEPLGVEVEVNERD